MSYSEFKENIINLGLGVKRLGKGTLVYSTLGTVVLISESNEMVIDNNRYAYTKLADELKEKVFELSLSYSKTSLGDR